MDDAEIQSRLLALCKAADAQEHLRWEKVKGKYPGHPGHNPAAWTEWLIAHKAAKDVSRKLREALPPKP